MNIAAIIFFIGVYFTAGLLTGITSFGGNLLAIPLVSLLMDAQDAIVSSTIIYFPVSIVLVLIYRRGILWGELIPLGIFSLLGVPIGVWLMTLATPAMLMTGAGTSIGLFLIWQLASARLNRFEKAIAKWTCVPFGLLGGIMISATGMGGPPIVMYAYLRKWSKENVLASLNMSGLIVFSGLIPAQWSAGFYNRSVIVAFIYGTIFSILGILASLPIQRRVNIALFRKLMLLVLAFAAITLLARGAFQ